MNGVPLLVVARNLGHSDTRMVEKHYGHLARADIAKMDPGAASMARKWAGGWVELEAHLQKAASPEEREKAMRHWLAVGRQEHVDLAAIEALKRREDALESGRADWLRSGGA